MNDLKRLLAGLEIFNKYGDSDVSAQHDIIYAGRETTNQEDSAKLKELGWHKEEEFECWGFST